MNTPENQAWHEGWLAWNALSWHDANPYTPREYGPWRAWRDGWDHNDHLSAVARGAERREVDS